MATNGVDTPNTPESNPITDQLAQAAAITGETVTLPLPGSGQTETVITDLGVTYRIDAADARFEQDQGNLVVSTDQGTIVLQDFFVLGETDLPPSLQLEDGQTESPETIIAQIDNFDPEAVAPAAGGGGGGGDGGGSGFTPYSTTAIGEGLDILDLLGNLDLTFGLPEGIDEVVEPEDAADATLSALSVSFETDAAPYPEIPLETPVVGNFGGGFEDWMPNADEGDYSVAPMRMIIGFTPADNEILEGIQVFPTGDFTGWEFLVNGVVQALSPSGAYVVLAADLDNITIRPPEDTDVDMPFTVNALIVDPDTGDPATISVGTVAVLDAVADIPSIILADEGHYHAEDNATTDGEIWTDGVPAYNIGFTTETPDQDGSEELTQVVVELDGLQIPLSGESSGTGILWNGNTVYDGDTIQIPALVFDPANPGTPMYMLVDATVAIGADAITFDNFSYIGSGEPVPFQVLALDFTGVAWDIPSPEPAASAYVLGDGISGTGLQVLLPQHSDDDFTVHVAVTSSETNLTGGELTVDNNNAVETYEFNVEVQAVADTPILTLQDIEVDEDAEPYTPPVPSPESTAEPTILAEATDYQLISAPPIGVTFPDQDGSESHAVFLSFEATPGVPCDQQVPRVEALSVLPDGFQIAYDTGDGLTIVDPESDGSYAIPQAYLDTVKIIAPKDWYGTIDVEVRAVATEDNAEGLVRHLTSEAVGTFTITVDATPDIFATASAEATESLDRISEFIIAEVSDSIAFEVGDDCSPEFTLTGLATTGLTSRGSPIDTIDISPDGHTLIASVGDLEIFGLRIDSYGHYTYTQYEPLDHGEGTATDDTLPIDFTFTLTDENGLGDSVDGSLQIKVHDDEPGVPEVSGNGGVTEDSTVSVPISTSGTVDAYVGADSDGGVRFVAGQTPPTGLSSEGNPILYQVTDGKITGYVSDPLDPVFVLTLAAGTYDFDLFKPLDHDHSDPVEDLAMTLDFQVETIDGDEDVAGPETLSVTITDDDLAANDDDVSELVEPGQTTTFVLGDLFDDYQSMDGVEVAVDGDGAGYDPSTGEITFSSDTVGEHEITVTLTDGDGDTATKSLTVVVGGVPQAYDNYMTFDEAELPKTNLLLIFDRSGSMDDNGGVNLQAAKDAVEALVDAYDDLGGFNLKLVTFANDATAVTGWFTDPADVMAYLNAISAGGTTHYDDALEMAAASWTDVPTEDVGDTVAYFLSDGVPNGGYLDSGEIAAWETFLGDNGFSEAYAIGMGAGAPSDEDLQDVAWSSDGSEGEIFIVSDLDLLTATVLSTLPDFDGNVVTDPAEAGPDIGSVDDPGTDGWPASDKLISVEYDGVVYTDDDNDGDIEITLTDSHGTVIFDTDTGDYTFAPGSAIDIADDVEHVMTYTIQDSDGSESSADLHLSLKDAGDSTAYDNVNAATLETIHVPTNVEAIVLSDFEDEDCTPGGGTYTPWIFDTKGDLPTPTNLTGKLKSVLTGDEAFDGDTIITPDNMWGRSSDDAEVVFNALRLKDDDEAAGTPVKVVTPAFTVDSISTAVMSFDITEIDDFNAGDVFVWKVLKWDGSDWVEIESHDSSTTTTGELEPGTYRLYFELDDTTDNTATHANISVDNLRLTTTTPAYDYLQGIPLVGNVITDPNTLASSSDPWNAVDDEGLEGANVTAVVFNGTEYGVTTGGTDIVGLYGTLHIEPSGDYTYTAFGADANLGQSDTFTYFLTQDDGDTDAADLVITIADETYVPPTPISGDSGNNVLDGTVGDDVILGGEGNDTLNGDDGDDHLEGEAGNDELHGGAGNDFLLGGDGTDELFGDADDDVLVGGEGDDQLTGGDGADTFLYTSVEDGHDAILDFDIAEDTIDLDAVFDALGANADLEVTGSDQDYTVTVSLDGVSQLDIDVHTTDVTDITALTAQIVTDEPG